MEGKKKKSLKHFVVETPPVKEGYLVKTFQSEGFLWAETSFVEIDD
jgi:hypothetical protein